MIRKATCCDAPAVARLAGQMWRGHSQDELTKEFEAIIAKEDCAVFVFEGGAEIIGFAQCAMRRDYVEGTESSPVGYLEGIFVEKACRGNGYAKSLLQQCECWAKERGCAEFASDCELTNDESLRFHLHCGFAEANRIICFTKKL